MPQRPRHVAIIAHPSTQSFNAAILKTYCDTVGAADQDVVVRDLYAIGFDPILKDNERPGRSGFAVANDVREELALIRGADVYTVIYPIWFGMPPAMLVGYVDRVIGSGVTAREVQQREGHGILKGGRLLSITTSGASDIWLDEQGQIDSLKNVMGRYLFAAFGMQRSDHLHLGHIVENYEPQFAEQALQEVRERTQQLCTMVADAAAMAARRGQSGTSAAGTLVRES